MQGIPEVEDAVTGGEMNGHVGNERGEYEKIHGGYVFGERNEAVEKFLDF